MTDDDDFEEMIAAMAGEDDDELSAGLDPEPEIEPVPVPVPEPAAKKKERAPRKTAPVALKEPNTGALTSGGPENEGTVDIGSLPESTRAEMAAGKAALEAKRVV
jgi:hypothetical protein